MNTTRCLALALPLACAAGAAAAQDQSAPSGREESGVFRLLLRKDTPPKKPEVRVTWGELSERWNVSQGEGSGAENAPAPLPLPDALVGEAGGMRPLGPAPLGMEIKNAPESVVAAGKDAPGQDAGPRKSPAVKGGSLPDWERVLSRPGVSLSTAPTDSAPTAPAFLPNYSILEVLQRRDGWVEVRTRARRPAQGWLREEDVLPWKHQLVVQFTSPVGRNRALFFKDSASVQEVRDMDEDARAAAVNAAYAAVDKGGSVPLPGVVAAEPDGWAEMRNSFYLMPIVDFTLEDGYLDTIEVAAVTENTENDEQVEGTTGMTLDVVFVMDLTRSMNPIREQVMAAVKKVAEDIRNNPDLNPDSIHFGIWGYRDDINLCKNIGFVTFDYTADGLLPADEFAKVLDQVEVTDVDSLDTMEDVLAGVHDAVLKTKWRKGAARAIILIGNAPGREPRQVDFECALKNPPMGTAANMGSAEIVAMADRKGIEIATVYIDMKGYGVYTDAGTKQFYRLATGGETNKAACVVRVDNPSEFQAFADDVIGKLAHQAFLAYSNQGARDTAVQGGDLANDLFRNARVRWLAEQNATGVTGDMRGWIVDYDLLDPDVYSVQPCVLLDRQQLDTLRVMLRQIIDACKESKESSTDLFDALQSVVVAAGKDPDLLDDAVVLSDSRFVPGFLKDLPYKSRVMSLSNEEWASSQRDAQDKIIETAEDKLKYYESIYKDLDMWMLPDENADIDTAVTPIPLNMLP